MFSLDSERTRLRGQASSSWGGSDWNAYGNSKPSYGRNPSVDDRDDFHNQGFGRSYDNAEPTNSSKIVCQNFLQNKCMRGSSCLFLHPSSSPGSTSRQPSSSNSKKQLNAWLNFCPNFQRGQCPYTDECRFLHVSKREENEYRTSGDIPTGVVEQAMSKAMVMDWAYIGNKPHCKQFLQGSCTMRGCTLRHINTDQYVIEVLSALREKFQMTSVEMYQDSSRDSGFNMGNQGVDNFGGRQGQDSDRFGSRQGQDSDRFGSRQGQGDDRFGGRQGQDSDRFGGRSGQVSDRLPVRSGQDNDRFGGRSGQDSDRFGGRSGQDDDRFGGRSGQDSDRFGGRSGQDSSRFGGRQGQDSSRSNGRQGQEADRFGTRVGPSPSRSSYGSSESFEPDAKRARGQESTYEMNNRRPSSMSKEADVFPQPRQSSDEDFLDALRRDNIKMNCTNEEVKKTAKMLEDENSELRKALRLALDLNAHARDLQEFRGHLQDIQTTLKKRGYQSESYSNSTGSWNKMQVEQTRPTQDDRMYSQNVGKAGGRYSLMDYDRSSMQRSDLNIYKSAW